MKIITFPGYQVGGTIQPERKLEVPCDFEEPEENDIITIPSLENFSYNVIQFEFTQDTVAKTDRLQFQIELNNNNNFKAIGFPYLTLRYDDGIEVSTSYANDAINACLEIEANGSCLHTYDKTFNGGSSQIVLDTFQLKKVEYLLTE
ncbi:hypothetical protein NBT05_04390 [Aquimarina sp. ERC-38]|uniref:hypothetical protein n=1 Tax=Aquimarina sp. ERC-38 TaxID=2949996 RepID=UPI002244FE6D|nr:hypothetical protein [Aquimarina sp. ERC-38]UZO81711.1 hypothetical protein NBT05_04390 [Aquimarina sp. ERC-38]